MQIIVEGINTIKTNIFTTIPSQDEMVPWADAVGAGRGHGPPKFPRLLLFVLLFIKNFMYGPPKIFKYP